MSPDQAQLLNTSQVHQCGVHAWVPLLLHASCRGKFRMLADLSDMWESILQLTPLSNKITVSSQSSSVSHGKFILVEG